MALHLCVDKRSAVLLFLFRSHSNYPTFVRAHFHYSEPIATMKFIAEIDVMPQDNLLDPQGKVVSASMKNLGLQTITNIRIGKHITLEIEADSREEAESKVDEACRKLLANLIMEKYSFELREVQPA